MSEAEPHTERHFGPFINPKQWGSAFWPSLHWLAAGYPDPPVLSDLEAYTAWCEEKAKYKQQYENLPFVLPCLECREHFKEVLLNRPLSDHALSSNMALRQWMVDIHNDVNQRTGSKQVWTLQDSNARYPPTDSDGNSLIEPMPKTHNTVHTDSLLSHLSQPVPPTTFQTVQLPPIKIPGPRTALPRRPVSTDRLIQTTGQRNIGRTPVIQPVVRRNIIVKAPLVLNFPMMNPAAPVKKKGCGCKRRV